MRRVVGESLDRGVTVFQPIVQFGTSRFLQAHVDLFVSQALAAEAGASHALGGITVVQTTASAQSATRVAALATGAPYPVRVRGRQDGATVDQTLYGSAVRGALQAGTQWPQVRQAVLHAQVIVSNTGDTGYALDLSDGPVMLVQDGAVPVSFPAKLLVLLYGRWQQRPDAPLSLLPCELVQDNGDVLRQLLIRLAQRWGLSQAFGVWLQQHCVWANSLVDRIVSQALEPVGAVAEPYALWAVQKQAGLVMPCQHPSIVLTDDLVRFERLKLFLLNGGHTYLAERWNALQRPPQQTVREAMVDRQQRAELEAFWLEEVLPVFDLLGQGPQAHAYLATVRERFENPFLAHRMADIFQNHAQKKQRRFAPVLALADQHGATLPLTRMRTALQPPGNAHGLPSRPPLQDG
jgi:tagaturonate reductase